MIELECRSCGYKFTSSKTPNVCPYCSKQGSVGLRKTSQDLLNETFGEIDEIDRRKQD
ncbi:hypothetical protein HYX06_04400 [Candidatus Woesearchaeota archaeon]|nr:hypothetical protein [Candidatus Woesearchaeota archaeon]